MTRKAAIQRIIISFIIALGIAVIYAPARNFDFVTFDDPVYVITNNQINQGLGLAAVKWSFNVGYAGNWHPLTWLSHALDCQLFGILPGPMHLVNVGLHAANSVILFLLLCEITQELWPSAFVAALFAWHPMHVESVAWISERKDVLSAFFFLLTIWAYWRYVRAGERIRPAIIWHVTAILFFLLGLMAKPMLVTLPFVLLLLDYWPLKRFSAAPNIKARAGHLVIEKAPFFILSALSCMVTITAQQRGHAVITLEMASPGVRLKNAIIAYTEYLDKLIWPRGLNVIYPYVENPSTLKAVESALILGAAVLLVLAIRRAHPYLLFGWFWFLGMLVPVIGFVQVGAQALADRYTYLPSIGLFVAVCWFISDLARLRFVFQAGAALLGMVLLTACLFSAHAQALSWRNGGTLFSRALSVNPDNYIARTDYAFYLLLLDDVKGAERECRSSILLAPSYAESYEYLGRAEFRENRFQEALTNLQKALQLEPGKIETRNQLGDVYVRLNRPVEAEEQYRDYIASGGGNPAAHLGLGKALAAQNRWEDARAEFAIAAQCPIPYAEAHAGLALALTRIGRVADAIIEYRAALRIHPNDLDSLNNLAWLLSTTPAPQLRDGREAVTLAQHACQLTDFKAPQLIGTLAAAYAEAGQFDDAVASAQKAHDLALAQKNTAVADRNLQLLEMYRARQAYHEP